MGTMWKVSRQQFSQAAEQLPKYKALAQLIDEAISAGQLLDGQKLPAQRWLADALGVTHGTVTRAYDLAEKRGLVRAKLGAGTFVTGQPVVADEVLDIDFAASMQPMMGQRQVLAEALEELAHDSAALIQMMTYAVDGVDRHRQVFSHWLQGRGVDCQAEQLIFTQGAQQGIFSCLQILAQTGELVLHEELCYPGFHRAAEISHLSTQAIALGENGLDLEQLEQICRQHAPKLLYITPNCQNPTNVSYSDEQRQKIIALSRKYQFYILEDDVNYCLPDNWQPPLWQQAPDRVFYLSSLSKYFAGGLRVGYMLAPPAYQQALKNHIHSQCWMVSSMNFELASRFIEGDSFRLNQATLAAELQYRQQVFRELFSRHGLKARFGGLNVWLELPPQINRHQLQGQLLAQWVKVRLADDFASPASGAVANAMRLSLGGPNSRALFERGVAVFDTLLGQLDNSNDVVI